MRKDSLTKAATDLIRSVQRFVEAGKTKPVVKVKAKITRRGVARPRDISKGALTLMRLIRERGGLVPRAELKGLVTQCKVGNVAPFFRGKQPSLTFSSVMGQEQAVLTKYGLTRLEIYDRRNPGGLLHEDAPKPGDDVSAV